MEPISLTTPALLFSAISLILLAMTNRFIAYSSVVRNLHDKYIQNNDNYILDQIKNLRKRLYLTRTMQIFGIVSLLLCVFTMLLIYVGMNDIATYLFGLALIFLILSFALLIAEIQISVVALELHLRDIEKQLKDN